MKIIRKEYSKNTLKIAYRCADGNIVEAVFFNFKIDMKNQHALIPLLKNALGFYRNTYSDRDGTYHTAVCISTQVGCPFDCIFCANRTVPFIRNLNLGEMVDEIKALLSSVNEKRSSFKLNEIQFAGIGEPLLNNDVLKLINNLFKDANLQKKLYIDKDNFIVILSTVGIVPGIYRLAYLHLPVFLQLSLHAPNDALRKKIIPSSSYAIRDIISAAKYYSDESIKPIIINYILINGFNDSIEYADELAEIIGKHELDAIVKLSYVNFLSNRTLHTSEAKVGTFARVLSDKGIKTVIFRSFGTDIHAGCGQLRAAIYEDLNKVINNVPRYRR